MRAIAAIAFLFSASDATAQTGAPQRLDGRCASAPESVDQLLRLMGYGAISHINCTAAEIDWSQRIAFFRDASERPPTLVFHGRPAPDSPALIIDRIEDWTGGPEPASGRCQMFLARDPGGNRTLACFASTDNDGEPRAHAVSFVIDEPTPEIGQIVQYRGACESSNRIDALRPLLSAALQEITGQLREDIFVEPVACDAAMVVGGSRVTFSQNGQPNSAVIFSGRPGTESTRIDVETIAFGSEPAQEVIFGTCIAIRQLDGSMATTCAAVYREAEDIQMIAAVFISPAP